MQSDFQTIVQENLYFLKRKDLLSQIESRLSTLFSKKTAVAAYIANTLMPGLEAAS
jgi:hypothetical protein